LGSAPGRDLPWQALGENAAEKATAKDLAEALYGIVSKHAEAEGASPPAEKPVRVDPDF
jgi:hypothetical protein